jgi:hypothetical protein
MSATFRKDGWYPSVFDAIGGLGADAFAGTSVETAFRQHTSDPAAFAAYLEKMKKLNVDDQQISADEMRSISAKTMVIVGDADGVRLEHALQMFMLRGGGNQEAAASGVLQEVPAARLMVLPAMSHVGISGESELLIPMIAEFLDDVPPRTPELF